MAIAENLYTPLSEGQIRLLVLERKSSASSDINCRLEVHNLSSAPSYQALSYVWGAPDPVSYIICNGIRTPVGPNLHQALRRLNRGDPKAFVDEPSDVSDFSGSDTSSSGRSSSRRRNVRQLLPWRKKTARSWSTFAALDKDNATSAPLGPCIIWIDAICINQKDNNEKASQVNMMREIYTRASRVIIWLGEEDKHVSKALSLMAIAMRNGAKDIKPVDESVPARINTARGVVVTDFPIPEPEQGDILASEDWDAFITFYENTWFSRVWIIQESVLASSAVMQIGNYSISWDAVGKVAQWIVREGYNTALDAVRLCARNAAFIYVYSNRQGKRLFPLGDLLPFTANFNATQPVDQIYGLLGLVDDTDITVDYTKSLQEVYGEAARHLLQQQPDLEVLSMVRHTQADIDTNGPSWVPQWHLRKLDGAASTAMVFNQTPVNQAYTAGTAEPRALRNLVSVPHISCRGIMIDAVRSFGGVIEDFDIGADLQNKNDILASESVYADLLEEDYITGESGMTALAYILTAGLDGNAKPAENNTTFLPAATRFLTEFFASGDSEEAPARRIAIGRWVIQDRDDTPLVRFLAKDEGARQFYDAVLLACDQHRLFKTGRDYIGLGPPGMRKGDLIAVLFGGRVPFVVRRAEEGGYTLVGECYIHGLMKGEAIEAWKRGEHHDDWVDIR